MEGFSLTWHTEHEFFHLCDQLSVRDATCAPPMHAEIAHGVEVSVAEQARLTPPVKRFAFFVMEQSHNSFLIVHISFLANKWTLHLIDRLLEKLLILSDEQLSNALKAVSYTHLTLPTICSV